MTQDEARDTLDRMPGYLFQRLRDDLAKVCDATMVDRASKYEDGRDRTSFFTSLAARTGQHPIDVCRVLLEKHLANISSKIDQAKSGVLSCTPEDLREPFCDARNYYDFLYALLVMYNSPPAPPE